MNDWGFIGQDIFVGIGKSLTTRKMKISQLILLSIFLILTSCDKNMPGGFWKEFDKNSIVINESDQGPYGGRRVIHWDTNIMGTYNKKAITYFATSNGWTLINTLEISKLEMMDWLKNSKLVFPIYLNGIHKIWTKEDLRSYTEFERYIDSDLTVYRFKTKWILIYPGTDESTNENGYLLVDKSESKMTLYQLWGE